MRREEKREREREERGTPAGHPSSKLGRQAGKSMFVMSG
jgi:hypothetical protein